MITIKDYVDSFDFSIEELTEDELKQVQEEVDAINSGKLILDGVLSHKI